MDQALIIDDDAIEIEEESSVKLVDKNDKLL